MRHRHEHIVELCDDLLAPAAWRQVGQGYKAHARTVLWSNDAAGVQYELVGHGTGSIFRSEPRRASRFALSIVTAHCLDTKPALVAERYGIGRHWPDMDTAQRGVSLLPVHTVAAQGLTQLLTGSSVHEMSPPKSQDSLDESVIIEALTLGRKTGITTLENFLADKV